MTCGSGEVDERVGSGPKRFGKESFGKVSHGPMRVMEDSTCVVYDTRDKKVTRLSPGLSRSLKGLQCIQLHPECTRLWMGLQEN